MKVLRARRIIVLVLFSLYPLDLFAEHPISERIRQRSTFRGAVLSDLRMKSMMFAFQLQNRPQLEQLLNDQQNPRSPSYHRWVTPAEFGKRFGVSPERYQSAVEWLQVQGFTVKVPLDSRLRIYFEGYARDVQRAFGVNMGWYEYQGKTYYSNDQPPGIPPELQNQGGGIYGLDNFPKEHPLYRVGLRNYLAPLDAQAGYNLTPLITGGFDGTGQSIAVVAASDFNLGDVQSFRQTFGLKPNDPQKFFVGDNPGIDTSGGEKEALLDTEWAGAIAPGATIQVVIAADSDVMTSLDYILNRLFSTRVISVSFGDGETDLPTSQASQHLQFLDSYFMQAAAQGQTVLISSGDEGARQALGDSRLSTGKDINYLCSSGYVVCVGGTKLNLEFDASGNAAHYDGETVWNTLSSGNGGASGGGSSRYVSKPAYQAGPGVPVDGARDVPDVAAVADPGGPGALIVFNGSIAEKTYGGTSLSTPIWAGVFALVNQFGSLGGVGWANPRLYGLGAAQQQSGSAPKVYNDIVSGNNSTPTVVGFSANTGYDLATGWGSFNGDLFVRNFAPHTDLPASLSLDGSTSATGIIPSGLPSSSECTLNPTQYTVEVPPDALQLVVTLDGPPQGDVDLYMRKGQPVADTGFFNPYIADYVSQGSTPHEAIYVGPTSPNPLIPGRYYIAMSNCASGSAAFTVSASVVTPTSPAKVEELSTDNGIVEDYFNNGSAGVYPPSGVNGVLVVNRLTPLRYPSTLTKIRIYSSAWDSQTDPAGQPMRIVAFSDTTGSGAPPSAPALLVDQAVTVPGSNGFMDYTVAAPPVIQSGDWYVGFQHPAAYNGIVAALNETGVWQQAGFVSKDNGQSFTGPYQQANSSPPPALLPANLMIRAVVQSDANASATVRLALPASGAAVGSTNIGTAALQTGYATAGAADGTAPYGTAVFSYSQNGIVLSEVGVPASVPTTHGRIFVDYRNGATPGTAQAATGATSTNTGLALVNRGSAAASVTFTMRDSAGASVASGHATIAQGAHSALFVDQLQSLAPDFVMPSDFSTAVRFGTLDIQSDQPLSILALRLTTNQRDEALLTSTPIADMNQTTSSAPLYFPQIADGGGYTTLVVLVNADPSALATESGKLKFFHHDGSPWVLQQSGGAVASTFSYSIPSGGIFVFQSDGSPESTQAGWAQAVSDTGSTAPVGAGMFSFTQGGILVTESGTPSATPTTHARIYVDKSNRHDTGLAVANPGAIPIDITMNAFQMDGITPAGASLGPVHLSGGGHTAAFAGEFISGLPDGFKGVLDVSAPTPFVALTLRSLYNARQDFLLTTFPIADFNQTPVSPLVFPQIASGGGYQTEIILLSISAGAPSTLTIRYYGKDGAPLALMATGN